MLRPRMIVLHTIFYVFYLYFSVVCAQYQLEVRGDLHFPLHARGTNKDGSLPAYKDPSTSVEARVNDLLPRMTLDEKVAQM